MEKLKKPMLIACGGFVILFIFMFIFGSCNKKVYTSVEFSDYLMTAAKDYYAVNKNSLPQTDGGKVSLSISNLVTDQADYLGEDNVCNGSIDVTNNNGYYMYTPNISCTDGYSITKLSNELIKKDNIVSSGNGLYQYNDYYIYRGEDVNNYLVFNNQLWRVVRVNADGSIKMIETNYIVKDNKNDVITFKNSKRNSVVWDNRYNEEKKYNSGFNDYIHDGINSRIKDELENIYKEYPNETKAYILKQNLCIGKRNVTDTINDGSIECSNTLSDQYVGLLQVNEYINASLDPSCVSAESLTCANYNYLSTFKSTFWSITTVKENSYDVYKLGSKISDTTASSTATPKVVITISGDVTFSKGNGTLEKPYIID